MSESGYDDPVFMDGYETGFHDGVTYASYHAVNDWIKTEEARGKMLSPQHPANPYVQESEEPLDVGNFLGDDNDEPFKRQKTGC